MSDEEKKELATPEERMVLAQIAEGDPPYNNRAQAILAVADGATQAEAAAQSNLTPNQVKYWLGRFRTRRLTVFPEELTTAVAEDDPLTELVEEAAETVVIEEIEVEVAAPEKSETQKPDKKKKKKKKKAKSKKEEPKKKKKSKSKKKKASAKKEKGKGKVGKKDKKKGNKKDAKGKKKKNLKSKKAKSSKKKSKKK